MGEVAQVLLVALGPLGENIPVELERGSQAPGGDAHVVQLLGVFAEPDAGLVGQHLREVATQDRKGYLAGRHRGVYLRGAEIRVPRRAKAGGGETRLELGVSGRAQL